MRQRAGKIARKRVRRLDRGGIAICVLAEFRERYWIPLECGSAFSFLELIAAKSGRERESGREALKGLKKSGFSGC